jgi:hypothetical protein
VSSIFCDGPPQRLTLCLEKADIHAGILAGLENGTLRPIVGKELPRAEAARAHKEILEPGSASKIVLICSQLLGGELGNLNQYEPAGSTQLQF